jgi:hypothetical protein
MAKTAHASNLADQRSSCWISKRSRPVSRVLSGDSHSSGMHVTVHLKRPTREPCGPHVTGEPVCSPIWSCSGWGFPCRDRLPVARCALTAPFHPCLCPKAIGGVFSVALSVGSRLPGVTWHPVLWSPDFPPRLCAAAAWPTPIRMILEYPPKHLFRVMKRTVPDFSYQMVSCAWSVRLEIPVRWNRFRPNLCTTPTEIHDSKPWT